MKPVLVVQVQDGSGDTLTATPLHDVVTVLIRIWFLGAAQVLSAARVRENWFPGSTSMAQPY